VAFSIHVKSLPDLLMDDAPMEKLQRNPEIAVLNPVSRQE
jgi:hypothetical protein